MQSPDHLNVQVCSCPPGYEGDPYTGCTQDPCNPSPCGENGICERNGEIQTICYSLSYKRDSKTKFNIDFYDQTEHLFEELQTNNETITITEKAATRPSPGPFTYKTRLRPHYAKQPFSAIVKTWPMVRLQLYLHQILLF